MFSPYYLIVLVPEYLLFSPYKNCVLSINMQFCIVEIDNSTGTRYQMTSL
jgi:hypothetical protein